MLVKMSQYGYRTIVLRLKWIPSWKFTHCDFHLILQSSSNILLPKFKWEKSCRHCTTLSGYFDRWNIRQREQWSHNSAVDPTRGYEGRSSARCSRGNWFPRLLARPFVIWRKSRERWLINSDTAGDTCERSERVCAWLWERRSWNNGSRCERFTRSAVESCTVRDCTLEVVREMRRWSAR